MQDLHTCRRNNNYFLNFNIFLLCISAYKEGLLFVHILYTRACIWDVF